eukprot:SAG31_NODE_4840_length_2912_cov_1.530750_1_plen_132_part_00
MPSVLLVVTICLFICSSGLASLRESNWIALKALREEKRKLVLEEKRLKALRDGLKSDANLQRKKGQAGVGNTAAPVIRFCSALRRSAAFYFESDLYQRCSSHRLHTECYWADTCRWPARLSVIARRLLHIG